MKLSRNKIPILPVKLSFRFQQKTNCAIEKNCLLCGFELDSSLLNHIVFVRCSDSTAFPERAEFVLVLIEFRK